VQLAPGLDLYAKISQNIRKIFFFNQRCKMAAKLKKKGKKTNPKPAKKPSIKKGKKERDDADEMTDLERDVDRGEDIETGISKRSIKEILENVDQAEKEDEGEETYEYGERGILSEEDETEDY
jgi:hypothetical protein